MLGLEKVKIQFYRLVANLRAKAFFPDDLDIDVSSFFDGPLNLKIAVIDDNDFPWKDTLESKGHTVNTYPDYFKNNTKAAQRKLKPYPLEKYDIVFCDIEGVGTSAYPSAEGVSVIQDIRERNPLQVIVAFTGSPARLLNPATGKNHSTIDAIFQRDWDVEDFLTNFNHLANIFKAPKERWSFLRNRLAHLGLNESKINKIRIAFTENILFLKYLGEKSNLPKLEIQQIILNSEKRVDIKGVIDAVAVSAKAVNIATSLFVLNGTSQG